MDGLDEEYWGWSEGEGDEEREVRGAMECDNIILFSTEAADFRRKMRMI